LTTASNVVASLTVDQDRPFAYFDYPAAHWKHLRTKNPIESTLATVRLRGRRDEGRQVADRRAREGVREWSPD
jgi:transposase-like protein